MSNDEWTTPKKLFDFLNPLFNFEIDLAATVENKLCHYFYSKENSALENFEDQSYEDTCGIWCNPPYSLDKEFTEILSDRGHSNKKIALLLPVRADRIWYQEESNSGFWKKLYFTGRLHFGNATKGAFMYSVLFYRHPHLTLPPYIGAEHFNDSGLGGAQK